MEAQRVDHASTSIIVLKPTPSSTASIAAPKRVQSSSGVEVSNQPISCRRMAWRYLFLYRAICRAFESSQRVA